MADEGPVLDVSDIPEPEPPPPRLTMMHFFDVDTGEYLRSARIQEDQTLPDDATFTNPPPSQTGHTIVWDGGHWNVKPDHRGATWYNAHGQPVKITTIGNPAEAGLYPQPPP